jgi:nucleoside-diphosphate-sugar epimerase
MKLLLTGGAGFLGRSILPQLKPFYQVKTLGSNASEDYVADLSQKEPVLSEGFDVVIHAAGKAHTLANSRNESQAFFKVNTYGTQNLCKALESKPPKAFIFMSTVAVYGLETGVEIDETYPLNGQTPYAQSKIQAEGFLIKWCEKYNIKLSILRPSLIAGKYPPGNLGAMIKAIENGRYFRIGQGAAKKSVLMADDIVRILPELIKKGGVYNMCDSNHPSFCQLENLIAKQLAIKSPPSIPFWIAKLMASLGDVFGDKAPLNTNKLNKITKSLTFSNQKAKEELNWQPLDVMSNFTIR